jgi:hypothetical protein
VVFLSFFLSFFGEGERERERERGGRHACMQKLENVEIEKCACFVG